MIVTQFLASHDPVFPGSRTKQEYYRIEFGTKKERRTKMSNRQVKGQGLLGQQPNGGGHGASNNNTSSSSGRGRGSYNKYSRGAGGSSSSATRRKPVPQQQQHHHQQQQTPSMYGGVMKEHNQQRSEKDAEALELEKTTKLNSEVCARMDTKFSELIKVAAQVALYEYDCPSSSWKPCNTRGSLFLYKRVVEPYLGLFILNRNSLENFALLITPQIEMQVVKPYIMMKTTEAIRCFWFYSEDECVEIASLISKKVGIPVKTETEVVKKKDSPIKPGSGPSNNHNTNNKPQCRASDDGAGGNILLPGSEGSHILNLLCNKVSSAKQNNVVQKKEAAEQEKISCQNRKPGQKGLTQQELDSLGEELRATLGIINAPMIMTDLLGSPNHNSNHNLVMMDGDHSEEHSHEQMTINSTFLNMEQMLQATLHLLKTEQGFAGKLEAAYMNSLSDC